MQWLKESYQIQDLLDTQIALKKFVQYCAHIAFELEGLERAYRNWTPETAKAPEFEAWKWYFEILSKDTTPYLHRSLWVDEVLSLLERFILEGYFDDDLNEFRRVFLIHRRIAYFSPSWSIEKRETLNKKWVEVFTVHHSKNIPLLISPIKSQINEIIAKTSVDSWISDVLNILRERSFLESKEDLKFLKDFLKFLIGKWLIPKKYSTIDNKSIESELLNIFTIYFLSWWNSSIDSEFKTDIKRYVKNYAWTIEERNDSTEADIYEDIPVEYHISPLLEEYIWELQQWLKIYYSENLDNLINILVEEKLISPQQHHTWMKMIEISEYHNEIVIEILYHLFINRFFEDMEEQFFEVGEILINVYQQYDCDGELNTTNIPDEWLWDYWNRLWYIEEYLANFVEHFDEADILRCSKQ